MIGLFGSGGTTGDVTNNFYGLSQYSSIDALKAATVPADGTKVVVGGYAANGDGGGGVFFYDEASSATDDGGTIIAPTEGSGRWKRVYSGHVNVRWLGAVGDGVADDTAPIQAAIDLVSANGGGEVYLPNGAYNTTAALVAASNVCIKGDFSRTNYANDDVARIVNAESHIFTQPAGTIVGFGIRNMYINASGGDVFHEFGQVANIFILESYVKVAAGYSVVMCSDATNFTECDFADSWFEHSLSATVPTFWLVSDHKAVNVNRWRRLRFIYSGEYNIHIESTSTGGYCIDNLIEDINCEVCAGGMVRLLSCFNTTLQRVVLYDLPEAPGGVTTKDSIYVGRSGTTGLTSRYTLIQNCGRRGGDLGSDLVDVKLQTSYASETTIKYSDNITIAGYTIDAGRNANFSFLGNRPTVTVKNAIAPAGSFACSLGTSLSSAMNASGTNSVLANNNCLLTGFILPFPLCVKYVSWFCSLTASGGNYDAGLLDATGNLLWSTGSTACPATGAQKLETLPTAIDLQANKLYWFAIAADNTTMTVKCGVAALTEMARLTDGTYLTRYAASSFPIPSSIDISGGTTVTVRNALAVFRQ